MARKCIDKADEDDMLMKASAPDASCEGSLQVEEEQKMKAREAKNREAKDQEAKDQEMDATIEEMLDEVDKIIAQLDSGEVPLEESFTIYERGMKLVKSINTRIDRVEKKIIEIEAEDAGC